MTQELVKQILKSSLDTKQSVLSSPELIAAIEKAGQLLVQCAKANSMIFSCGNGGSTCDAMHLTEELVGRYKRERRGIRAMHLMDSSVLTCWANDYSFEEVYARQIETFGKSGDILVAFSTSGNSKNVLRAVEEAKKLNMLCIGLLGKGGGKLASQCDLSLVIPSSDTERIQEMHLTIVHVFCEILENSIS